MRDARSRILEEKAREALAKSISDGANAYSELSQEVEVLRNEKERIVREKMAELTALNRGLSAAKDELEAVSSAVKSQSGVLDAKTQRIGEADATIARCAEEQAQFTALSSEITTAGQKLSSVVAETRTAEDELSLKRAELRKIAYALVERDAELTALSTALVDAEISLSVAKARKSELDEAYDEKMALLKRYADRLQRYYDESGINITVTL